MGRDASKMLVLFWFEFSSIFETSSRYSERKWEHFSPQWKWVPRYEIFFFFFSGCVYLSCRTDKTRDVEKWEIFRHASRSKNPSQASNVHGWLRMESFRGHSRGNSIRHTKSSAQDAPRSSTLSLNSASLKLAWLVTFFFPLFFPFFFLLQVLIKLYYTNLRRGWCVKLIFKCNS